MRLLIVEDDRKIAGFIVQGLKEEGYSVDVTHDGDDGLYMAQMGHYDAIVLDWMLPGLDGIEITRRLRGEKDHTPILMLTARGDVEDRVQGLEGGADDFLGKPFAFSELVARIKALLRRSGFDDTSALEADDLTLDPRSREVRRGGRHITLGTKEYELLEYLLRNKDKVVTNTMIVENVWDLQEQIESNVINVTIYNLRKKVDRGFSKKLIRTIRGSGYRLETS